MTTSQVDKIIVTGHPYAFPYYFKVFEYVENKEGFVFILPKLWLAKKGKIRIKLEQKPGFGVYGLRAASYGGHGLGGLFKGWLPGIIFLLPYLKLKYKSKVLYSCSEPNLLTTLCNGLLAKLCGMKYIFFTWQNVAPQKYMSGLKLRIYTTLVRFNLFLTDGVICGNKKAQKIIYQLQTTNCKLPILVCPLSGVDTEKFRPGIASDWRERFNIKPEEKLILFYGALDKRKGLNVLIDAFDKICQMKIVNHALAGKSGINCRLAIIGTGPEQEKLRLQVTGYRLQEKVIFLDWMSNDQLPALLNTVNVFVYPSVPSGGWEEQFGYAMAEASACGVPVVATRTGSIDEVVADGRSGLLVEPNNADQLAGAIYKILVDNILSEQMGEFGQRFVIENFNHSAVANKILKFLHGYTA